MKIERKFENNETIEELTQFIQKAVTPFHTVQAVRELLTEHGFKELNMEEPFEILRGGSYFVTVYESSLMAFTVGEDFQTAKAGLRCTSSHTDFPGFKLKPETKICMETGNGNCYIKCNTEVYGGPILNTWMDRPLSLAGRLVLKGENAFEQKDILVNVDYPVFVIPNLAIHMNREVNKGVELNRQKDMLPLMAVLTDNVVIDVRRTDAVLDLLLGPALKEQGIRKDEILDYELFVYSFENGQQIGLNGEMFSAPRLDNLTSVLAQTKALIQAKRENGLNVAMYFDHEEIGSRTKQGAASQSMMLLMEKIYASLGFDRQQLINDMLQGTMISCDVAHAYHPNAPEKSDLTNRVMLNKGIVIKQAAGQSYANDAYGVAMVKQICKENQIDYQVFVNRSDMAGGQTLGAISSTVMPFRTIDIGIPLLAMHSARELMGTKDQKNLEKFLTGYYS